mgnify:FL=1
MMTIAGILSALESSGLSLRIRESLYLFPVLESFHALGLTLVFGTIAVIDLRLLGLASTRRPFSVLAADTLKWTWMAFALTVLTGALMFITNATVYFHNVLFQSKMALIALSGVNMQVFELTARRSVKTWDRDASAPPSGKIVATVSLLFWMSVIVLGRWVGFTTTRITTPVDQEINIEDFLPK